MNISFFLLILLSTNFLTVNSGDIKGPAGTDRSRFITNSYGTYDGEPRKGNGRVNIERLIRELSDVKANTYNWLIWHAATDWEDLKIFLPVARRHGIRVWVTLVPPSESPPRTKFYSEPFRLDYERWGEEIARLSITEPNLVAWSIDDFTHNLEILNPERMEEVLNIAHEINPELAFVPCSYYPKITAAFISDYKGIIDGILFPYRHESAGANLKDPSLLPQEMKEIKKITGASVPVVVDVYATGHSSLGNSTPQYVRDVMTLARRYADGVLIYCHQDPEKAPEKYGIIRELFREWTGK